MAASRWLIVLLALLVFLVATLLGSPATAEPAAPPAEPDPTPVRVAEILQSLDRPEPGESWYAHHLARMGISGKYGLVYTRYLEAGDKGMRLRFGGPVLGKTSRMGLSIELRF